MNRGRKVIVAMLSAMFIFNSQVCFGEGFERTLPVEEKLKTIRIESFDELYVSVPEMTEPIPKSKVVSRGVPRGSDGSFKTYMDFKTITSKSSPQYKLQQECWTDSNGFRRHGEYYTVALGSFYAKSVGQKFIVTLETGRKVPVMVGDFKQDRHTNETNQYVNLPNKNIVEFIIETSKLNELSRKMGDVSYSENEILKGSIVSIEEILE